MFDIGFTELLLCLVVALVVIGPEQLPGTVRTVGLWIGRMKRSLRDTRNEIERQIGADDIRRQLHNEEVLENIEAARIRFEKTILEAEQFEDAEAEARRKARSHAALEELPNHAHDSPAADTTAVTPQPDVTAVNNNTATENNNAPATSSTPANVHVQSGTGH